QQLGCFWYEEPIVPYDHEGYAELAAALDMRIACGENECNKHAFMDLLLKKGVDVVQPDNRRAGGPTEWLDTSPTSAALSSRPQLWNHGNCAATCCPNSASGRISANRRMYLRLRGEKPFISSSEFMPLVRELLRRRVAFAEVVPRISHRERPVRLRRDFDQERRPGMSASAAAPPTSCRTRRSGARRASCRSVWYGARRRRRSRARTGPATLSERPRRIEEQVGHRRRLLHVGNEKRRRVELEARCVRPVKLPD